MEKGFGKLILSSHLLNFGVFLFHAKLKEPVASMALHSVVPCLSEDKVARLFAKIFFGSQCHSFSIRVS